MVSAFVLTLDEAANIEACLESLSFCSEVFVIDSGSTDETTVLAESCGAKVVERKLHNWAEHGNWILSSVNFAEAFVLYLDADERVPEELRAEIESVLESPGNISAYQLRYTTYLFNRPLRHGGVSDVWVTRLMRPEAVRYEQREVNAHPRALVGDTGRLKTPYIHHTFSKGMREWFVKHNNYSSAEAREAAKLREGGLISVLREDGLRRRLKNASFFLPFRGTLRFIYVYVLRRGFLDGVAGLWYALSISMYESWLGAKLKRVRAIGSQRSFEHDVTVVIEWADSRSSRRAIRELPCMLRWQGLLIRRMLRAETENSRGWVNSLLTPRRQST